MKALNHFISMPRHCGRALMAFFNVTLAVSLLAILCQLNFETLVFDKHAVSQGEYWRLLSGHFTHSSLSHGFWDVLAFSASLTWLAWYSAKAIVPALMAGTAVLGVLLVSELLPFQYYCGLSGLLFSPLIVASYFHAKRYKNLIGIAPLLLISLKLITDLLSEDHLLVATHWYAFPASHCAGAIAGVLVIFGHEIIAKRPIPSSLSPSSLSPSTWR